MPKLGACLKHRQDVPYRGARDAWHGTRQFPKPYRAQLQALDHLINGIGTIIYGRSGVYTETAPGGNPAGHFRELLSCLTLSKAEVEAILIRHRLDDFTAGRGDQIEDEDVGLACLAACEVGKYEIAHEIALRGVLPGEMCSNATA